MPSLQNITAKIMLKFLQQEGFIIHHQKGSHVQLKRLSFFVTVPNHSGKNLKIGTLLSILRQAGIEKEYFLNNI